MNDSTATLTQIPSSALRILRPVPALTKRAFGSYFGTIATYPVLLGFYLLVGFLYRNFLLSARVADLGPFLEQLFFLLLLVVPVLCMRLVSEEVRSGSIDLLYARGISPTTIVISKYFAAVGFAFLVLAVPVSLAVSAVITLGNPDEGQIVSQILGLMLVTLMLCALGIATSAVVVNPLVAAVLGEVVGLFLWFTSNSGPSWSRDVFAVRPHLAGFTAGELALADLIYLAGLLVSGLTVAIAGLRIRRG